MNQKDQENQLAIEEVQHHLKKFVFTMAHQYLKFCQTINANIFYLAILVQTLQILWYIIHPTLTFLGQPIALKQLHQFLSFFNFEWHIRQNSSLIDIFIILSFALVIINIAFMIASAILIFKKQSNQVVKIINKISAAFFILVNTIFTIPLLTISIITIYCTQDSIYHVDRVCYDPLHLVYCSMSVVIMVFLIFDTIMFWFLFYEKNPFSKNFFAWPDNLWKLGKFLIKILPVLYFIVDTKGGFTNIYLIIFFIIWCGYLFLFRIFSNHSYYQIHFYVIYSMQVFLVWFCFNNVMNYYLPSIDSQLTLIQTTVCAIIFTILFNAVEMQYRQRNFIENLQGGQIKKQNIDKFLAYFINNLLVYKKNQRVQLLAAVKILNSKIDSCNLRISQLFRNKQLKPQEQISIMYQFLELFITNSLKQYMSMLTIKSMLCFIYFQNNKKLLAIHSILELQKQKISLSDSFMIYQFVRSKNIFFQDYQKQVMERNNVVTIYYEYTKEIGIFENLIEQCAFSNKDYWQELGEDVPSLTKLRSLCDKYIQYNREIKQSYDRICSIFPNNLYAINLYKNFLLHIGINIKELVEVFQKLEIEKDDINEQSETSQEGLIMFKQNDRLCVVSVDTSQNGFGNILSCNREIMNLLGYQKKDLIGYKVTKIMPKVYADIHDSFIRNFIEQKITDSFSSEKTVFALNKQGFLIHIALHIKIVPHQTKGFQIIAFIKEISKRKQPAYVIVSKPNWTIEGVSVGFTKLINQNIDLSSYAKQSLTINSLLPDLKMSDFRRQNSCLQSSINFSNFSDRALEGDQQIFTPKNVMIKFLYNKYYSNSTLYFLEVVERNRQSTKKISWTNKFQFDPKKKANNNENYNFTQSLQQLPIERKLEDYIASYDNSSLFSVINFLFGFFILFIVITSLATFMLAFRFTQMTSNHLQQTNNIYNIYNSMGRINMLIARLVYKTQTIQQPQFNAIISQLSKNIEINRNNTLRILQYANNIDISLQFYGNDYHHFKIMEQSELTPALYEKQLVTDALLQYISLATDISLMDLTTLHEQTQLIKQKNQFIEINGRDILPMILNQTAVKIEQMFYSSLDTKTNIQIYIFFGKCVFVLVTFVFIIIVILKLNEFDEAIIQIYNSILLWDINQLKIKCQIFIEDHHSELNKTMANIQVSKTKIRQSRMSALLNIFPKELLVDIINYYPYKQADNSSKIIDFDQEQQQLISKMKGNKHYQNGNIGRVNIKQLINFKKSIIAILLIFCILIGISIGLTYITNTYSQKLSEKQTVLINLGIIKKNLNFMTYFSYSLLIGKSDQIYLPLFELETKEFYKTVTYFYQQIGDPQPILKNIYTKIEELKRLIYNNIIQNPQDLVFTNTQQVFLKSNDQLNKLSLDSYMEQKSVLKQFNNIEIIKLVISIFISITLLKIIDICLLTPLNKTLKQSINMIRMLPIWLIKKNGRLKSIIEI